MSATTPPSSGPRPGSPGDLDLPLSRDDLVLTVIPFAFLLGAIAGQLASLSLETALAGASLLCVAALADALFVNPPGGARHD